MKTQLRALQLFLMILLGSSVATAQSPPIYPSPDHEINHDAVITGKITISPESDVLSGTIAKLSRVVAGSPDTYVAVSYALSDQNGNFSLTGQSGVVYRIEYIFPTDGFTAKSSNPSGSFTATAGNQTAPDGGISLERVQNTITHCNVTEKQLTDWSATIPVAKAVQLNSQAVLKKVAVFSSTQVAHPLIDVHATTASTIRSLKIGADIALDGPGYSDQLESLKTFANTPAAQNINLAAGQQLTYYDISSAQSAVTVISPVPAEYQGSGTVDFSADAFASKTITTNGGNTSSSEQTYAAAGVCLTYIYDIDPLPVKLISFQAQYSESQVNLLWKTASETNSDHFQVQRSNDAKSWSVIGAVNAGAESKAVLSYTFSDAAPVPGINYYRLKMIDQDASFTYSGIRSADTELSQLISFYPNPASDYLQIDQAAPAIAHLSVINLNGTEVYSVNEPVSGSLIDIKNFQSGIYLVKFQLKNGTLATHKMVKK
ncbi:T9SS type A sorting domain-containing protein [Dyadobacter sp. CY356]|uniref:T9SS type A sorting domain-containing protein n=1 Tax=Dyadobacter sp. CY356 TaxID=2906442 RepID=UPI001F194ECE|nr:T9SS type A sorting domain-containing protein [Dyadobacter sp. CY356]MCF0055136.1 T9SS type A sorting domain-containing protein [Dyadobacter sp. CY356]